MKISRFISGRPCNSYRLWIFSRTHRLNFTLRLLPVFCSIFTSWLRLSTSFHRSERTSEARNAVQNDSQQ